ncbi:ubiquitin-like-conjugating enzyme ATG3 [Platysternon megacephalum]|uniref:Ubiquitin-like-conjugating enzyme ATG3 n=1 Tax=Platysternon megacephalum TaxID=55544 RepID=A0A4D9DNN8_9SAUR|nr:ubiquitin-like-conjugating enzyme ATG3 [Platysternon megacephalum]
MPLKRLKKIRHFGVVVVGSDGEESWDADNIRKHTCVLAKNTMVQVWLVIMFSSITLRQDGGEKSTYSMSSIEKGCIACLAYIVCYSPSITAFSVFVICLKQSCGVYL